MNESLLEDHEHNAIIAISFVADDPAPSADRKKALWDIQVYCKQLRDRIILEEREEKEGKG